MCAGAATRRYHLASLAAVGTTTVDFSTPDGGPPINLLEFDDDAWASVTNKDGTFSADCTGITSAKTDILQVVQAGRPGSGTVQRDVRENSRPHYWYFTFNNLDCITPYSITYTLTLKQADGSQLGYDEQGMPSIYGAFFFFMFVALLAHLYMHYGRHPRFGPLLVIVFTVALGTETVSTLLLTMDWAIASSDGAGAPWLTVIGELLHVRRVVGMRVGQYGVACGVWVVECASGTGCAVEVIDDNGAGAGRTAATARPHYASTLTHPQAPTRRSSRSSRRGPSPRWPPTAMAS